MATAVHWPPAAGQPAALGAPPVQGSGLPGCWCVMSTTSTQLIQNCVLISIMNNMELMFNNISGFQNSFSIGAIFYSNASLEPWLITHSPKGSPVEVFQSHVRQMARPLRPGHPQASLMYHLQCGLHSLLTSPTGIFCISVFT